MRVRERIVALISSTASVSKLVESLSVRLDQNYLVYWLYEYWQSFSPLSCVLIPNANNNMQQHTKKRRFDDDDCLRIDSGLETRSPMDMDSSGDFWMEAFSLKCTVIIIVGGLWWCLGKNGSKNWEQISGSVCGYWQKWGLKKKGAARLGRRFSSPSLL